MPTLNALDHYRLLGRSGMRVSPLALGTLQAQIQKLLA